jgi:hypothetical protein
MPAYEGTTLSIRAASRAHARSSADYIINMSGFGFSVPTACRRSRISMMTAFGALQRHFAGWRIQKRKRNPVVGAKLLRWRNPEANPLFTCVNMKPK